MRCRVGPKLNTFGRALPNSGAWLPQSIMIFIWTYISNDVRHTE
jgi:hypothetical protein